jgi:hemerythrin-like metal-binding protein
MHVMAPAVKTAHYHSLVFVLDLKEGRPMSIAHWSTNLSVGVEELDSDHRELIELLNRLDIEVGRAAHQDEVARLLDELMSRTQAHFRREEELMAQQDYPDAGHHARLHRALIEEMQEFREDMVTGMEVGPEITDFIKRWLVSHIIESDKHLGGFLEGRKERSPT